MTLRNRIELKSFFKNDRFLAEEHFADLIDSMLNKRKDQFHGIWRPGQTYRKDDVVIHKFRLWVVIADDEICSKQEPGEGNSDWKKFLPMDDDGDWIVQREAKVMWANREFDKIGIGVGNESGEDLLARLDVRREDEVGRWLLFPESSDQGAQSKLIYTPCLDREEDAGFSSSYLITRLTKENVTWQSNANDGFVFQLASQHFQTTEASPNNYLREGVDLNPDGKMQMVVRPNEAELATLGLNSQKPDAILDITAPKEGKLLFAPEEKTDPVLAILNLNEEGPPKNYVAIGVGRGETALVSDTPSGFVFRQETYGNYCQSKDANQGELLMKIRQNPKQLRPQVGIGTDYPQARLDIKDDEHAQVHILPEQPTLEGKAPSRDTTPVITIMDLLPNDQPAYLTMGLGDRVAGLVNNAERGFVFRQGGPVGIDSNQHQIDRGNSSLAIREDGRIGMGTEEPYTNLEIVNASSSGKFLFNLDRKVNPALGILNLRPESKSNYFTLGADNNRAILVTDSEYGFLFKAGQEFDTNDSQIDINQGDMLVSIRPEGKGRMGIGKEPRDYELDIHGMTRGFAFYQDTNSDRVGNIKPLTEVLEKIKSLKPVTYEWNANTGFQNAGEQIGLLAHEVEEVFPQVVKTDSDGTQAVAYQNLVPVLIQALKEMTEEKDRTQQELETLRNEFTLYQQQMEERLQQLNDRIEQL